MYEKKFTLRHVIKNFSELKLQHSPVKVYFGVPWTIRAKHQNTNLGLLLMCKRDENLEKPWSIDVDYEIRVVTPGKKILTESGGHKYTSAVGWGFQGFRSWEYVLKNYAVDNMLTVECEATIKSMTGIVQKRMMSFENPRENLTDMVLKVGEEEFNVSKTLLATFSPYFKTMFYSNFAESKKKKIELKEVDPEDFQQLLEIVHGKLSVKPDNVEVLLYLANRFDVEMIRSRCEEFLTTSLEMTNKNKLRIADAHNLEDVKNHIFKDVKTPEDVRKLVPSNVRELDPSTVAKLLEITLATP